MPSFSATGANAIISLAEEMHDLTRYPMIINQFYDQYLRREDLGEEELDRTAFIFR